MSSAQIWPVICAFGLHFGFALMKVSRMLPKFFSAATGIGWTFLVWISAGRRSAMVSQQSKSFEPDRILVCASGNVAAVPSVEPTPDAFLKSARMRSCTVTDRPMVRSACFSRAEAAQACCDPNRGAAPMAIAAIPADFFRKSRRNCSVSLLMLIVSNVSEPTKKVSGGAALNFNTFLPGARRRPLLPDLSCSAMPSWPGTSRHRQSLRARRCGPSE